MGKKAKVNGYYRNHPTKKGRNGKPIKMWVKSHKRNKEPTWETEYKKGMTANEIFKGKVKSINHDEKVKLFDWAGTGFVILLGLMIGIIWFSFWMSLIATFTYIYVVIWIYR